MKDIITYDDFAKLDLRIGRIVAATAPEWSNKLLQFTVDFGPELGEKTIFSGVRKWYEPDSFIGHDYVFIINLAERRMGNPDVPDKGGISQGMMLMADGADKPVPFTLPIEVEPGTVVC